MVKKNVILKTHGLRNSSEAGMVVLPESFYVKVRIEKNGDFDVEFINSSEEQLFSVCHQIKSKAEIEPADETIRTVENRTARFIVDSLAEYVIDDTQVTYDTEAHLEQWAAKVSEAFING